MLIQLSNCVFGYDRRPVVRVDELGLCAGQCTGIFGPNGAGKTTLVRGLTGLLIPIQGTVRRVRDLRIGYLPQHRALELHWPMTGLDAASLAVSARSAIGRIDRGNRHKILSAMARFSVDHLAHRSFATLSGGQQQRLLLAGALAAEPQILILDEPTEGLDVRSQQNLLELLRDMAGGGLSIVMISHEIQDLLFLAQSVAWLHPAEEEHEPSHVEMVSPAILADRTVHVRQTQ